MQHSHTAPLASIYACAKSAQQTVRILPGTLELERVKQLCRGQNLLRKPAMGIKVHIFHNPEMHLERVTRSSLQSEFSLLVKTCKIRNISILQKVEGLSNPRGLYIVSLFTDPQFSLKTVRRARVIKYKPQGIY